MFLCYERCKKQLTIFRLQGVEIFMKYIIIQGVYIQIILI